MKQTKQEMAEEYLYKNDNSMHKEWNYPTNYHALGGKQSNW